MKRLLAINILAGVVLTLHVAAAAAKADFSGMWVMDKSRSEGVPPDMEQTMTVTQNADTLNVETKVVTDQGDQTVTGTYTFNGQEMTYTPKRGGADGKGQRTGDGSKNSDYYCYGEPLIAVADAKVVDVRDDIPENDPSSSTTAVPVSFETVAGNHVVLDLGQGRYALYAHMQPGKMRVKIGEHVRRGQVLGLLGNSGNAVGPHLHFHIADSPVALDGEGLPFVIDSFEVLGVESPQAFKEGVWRPDPNFKVERRRMEMPIDSTVVRFP